MRTVHHMFMVLEKIAELLITVHSYFLSLLLTVCFAYKECLKLYYVYTYGTQCSVILNFTWLLKGRCLKAVSLLYTAHSAEFCACRLYSSSICIIVAVTQPCCALLPLSVFYFINSLCFTTKTVLVTIWKSISTLWKCVS